MTAPMQQGLRTEQIENEFSDNYTGSIKVSYIDGDGKDCHVELHLSASGCMVIGKDGDEKYTF